MRHRVWLWLGLFALLLAVFIAGGCSLQLKWFGAGGVDCEWDDLDFKQYEKNQQPLDDFRNEVEKSMRKAEEEQKKLEFGPCTEGDLANRTCH